MTSTDASEDEHAADSEAPVIGPADDRPPGRYINGYGYAYYQVRINGDRATVQEHQLVALLMGEDPEKVFSNGEYQVHHKHNVPDRDLDIAFYLRQFNYPDNLTLLKDEEHARLTNED